MAKALRNVGRFHGCSGCSFGGSAFSGQLLIEEDTTTLLGELVVEWPTH